MLCLGADPGRSGSAVLSDEGRAVAVASWRLHQSGGRKVYALSYARLQGAAQARRGLQGAWALGEALRVLLAPVVAVRGGALLLGCEAAHAGRNVQTGLRLSRWAGALVGPLERWAPHGQATWAEPDEWRREVFRPKWWRLQCDLAGAATSRGRAEAQGLYFMPKRQAAKLEAEAVIPPLMPDLDVLLARLPAKAREHALDAAGVCLWRAGRENK